MEGTAPALYGLQILHFRRWCGGEGEHNPIDLAGFPRIANRLIGSRLCMKYRRSFGNGFIIIAARRSRLISRCSDVQMSSGIADISNIAGLGMVLRNIYEFGCFRIASDSREQSRGRQVRPAILSLQDGQHQLRLRSQATVSDLYLWCDSD